MSYELYLASPDFELLYNGFKTLECQLITDSWEKIKLGDTIMIKNNLLAFKVAVAAVNYYFPSRIGGYSDPLAAMLSRVDNKKLTAGLRATNEITQHYQKLLGNEQIMEHGLIVLELRVAAKHMISLTAELTQNCNR